MISHEEPSLSLILSFYVNLRRLFQHITKKEGNYVTYDSSLIDVAKKWLDKFSGYFNIMKSNNVY